MSHPTEGGLPHPGAIIMGPTSELGVEVANQGRLGPCPTAATYPPELRQMRLGVGLGGCDQRVEPEPLVAPGSFPGLVCARPILTDGEPQTIHGCWRCHTGLTSPRGVARSRRVWRPKTWRWTLFQGISCQAALRGL